MSDNRLSAKPGDSLFSAEQLALVERAVKVRSGQFRHDTGVCLREARNARRAKHIEQHDALVALTSRLRQAKQITDDEAYLLYHQAEEVWDDAIHVASLDDPLRSLCGNYGRNLADVPDVPDGGSGCWTCIGLALELIPALAFEPPEREVVQA